MMKAYWQNLSERDRWALGVGGVIVCLYLLYQLVFSPLILTLEEKKRLHSEKHQTLAWMNQVQALGKNTKTQKPLSNAQLLSLLSSKLKAKAFIQFPYQLQQVNTGDIQLSFDSVPFSVLILWLYELNQNYSFSVKQLKAQHLDTPGLVKISLVLTAN